MAAASVALPRPLLWRTVARRVSFDHLISGDYQARRNGKVERPVNHNQIVGHALSIRRQFCACLLWVKSRHMQCKSPCPPYVLRGSISRFVCYQRMRKVLLVTCVLVLVSAASTADARHGRRHWHKYYFAAVPYAYEVGRPGNNLQRRRFGREAVPYAYGFGRPEDNFRGRRQWRESVDPAVMVPPNWQLQPPDPNWGGKRFLSPDGSSWLAVYIGRAPV